MIYLHTIDLKDLLCCVHEIPLYLILTAIITHLNNSYTGWTVRAQMTGSSAVPNISKKYISSWKILLFFCSSTRVFLAHGERGQDGLAAQRSILNQSGARTVSLHLFTARKYCIMGKQTHRQARCYPIPQCWGRCSVGLSRHCRISRHLPSLLWSNIYLLLGYLHFTVSIVVPSLSNCFCTITLHSPHV